MIKQYYVGKNKAAYRHNLSVLPNLIMVPEFSDIEASADDYIFFLKDEDLVFDTYRPTRLHKVEQDLLNFGDICSDLGKDFCWIPVVVVNYKFFPPKSLSYNVEPRIFKYGKIDKLNEATKKDKKSLYSMIFFKIYQQVLSDVEVGQELPDVPKMVSL